VNLLSFSSDGVYLYSGKSCLELFIKIHWTGQWLSAKLEVGCFEYNSFVFCSVWNLFRLSYVDFNLCTAC
jgi:hypothetical protein